MRTIVKVVGVMLTAAAVAVSLTLPIPHQPRIQRIILDNGGNIDDYIVRYAHWRLRGDRVIIDGQCISACTFVTGLIPADRVCVTPRASLAFHSAWYEDDEGRARHSSEGTRQAWHLFPLKVREMLIQKHQWDGDDKTANLHPDLIYIEGEELETIYKPCED